MSFPSYGQMILDDYGEQPDVSVIRSEMEGGLAKQIKVITKNTVQRPITMVYNDVDMTSFKTWFKDSVDNGSMWFDWVDPADNLTKLARIVGGEYQSSSFVSSTGNTLSWKVVFSLETLEPPANWVDQNSGVSVNLRSVWYDASDSLWVVCGNSGTMLSSPDGESWTPRTSGTSNSLRTVKKWKGNWYAVGWGDGVNPATVLKSADGINWSSVDIGGGESHLVEISFNDTTMVFVGWTANTGGDSLYVTTSDGVVFNKHIDVAGKWLYGVEWDGDANLWGVVGDADGSLTPYFATSPDLSFWTERTTDMASDIWVAHYINGVWMLGTGNGELKTTTDLVNFVTRNTKTLSGENIWRIVHNSQDVLIMAGGYNHARLLQSVNDGSTWIEVYNNADIGLMSKAFYGPGYWVAVGWAGTITRSRI